MEPRPYQSRTLDACRAQFRAGKRAVLVVSPTGSGKTCIGVMMGASHLAKPPREGRPPHRLVWLCHRKELRDQASSVLQSAGISIGRGTNASALAQVCSIQALLRRREAPDGTLVVVDEAHHQAMGGDWAELVRTYLSHGARIVGLTATPSRADGSALEGFDSLVVAAQIRELTNLGHLVPLKLKRPEHQLGKDKIAQAPVDAYLEHARGRHAVVFAPHIKAAEEYASGFRGLGVACEIVTGKTATFQRETILGRFSAGSLPVIINVAVLTEGWDATICDCVILGRGCGSPGLLVQMTGRGLRPHHGKSDCILIDLRGVTWQHGRPDADAQYSLTGEGIVLRGAQPGERICRVCGVPMGDATVCPECGKDSAMIVPQATGDKLVDWEEVAHEAVKEQLKPNRAVLSLAGMIRKHKLNKALVMFRYIFKRHPDTRTIAQAQAFNRARASAEGAFTEHETP
jgi:superfamily II DNA or RNA helicase